MKLVRWVPIGLSVVVVCAATAFAALQPAAIPAVDPPAAARFSPEQVQKGAVLAAIGNCTSCHSAPDRPAYSGGVPLPTPFGTIYGSNITPDPDTGIGRWSEAAFRRALRAGVDRDGHHLYPAFPYDHFTRVTDEDAAALYAFMMTRAPARAAVPANALPFPLNVRLVMAGWNALFFRPGAWQPDPFRDPAWNRGAYLVEGLGHCGACHTPRNSLGAERGDQAYAGGNAEGWTAYALNDASPAPIPWTVDALSFYLKHGWEEHHGVARGPMAAVTAELGAVPDRDLAAMGTYLVGLMGVPSAEKQSRARTMLGKDAEAVEGASAGSQVVSSPQSSDRGEQVFASACGSCHSGLRPVPFGGLNLALSTAIQAPDPANIITVTLNGLSAPPGEPGAIMPGFAGALDDTQVAALLAYLRDRVAHQAPWPDLEKTVAEVRHRGATLHPSDGTTAAPSDTDVRATKW